MLKLKRIKNKNLLTSLIYKIGKKLPLKDKNKFVIFSNLSWVFKRLSFETSNNIETYNHQSKIHSIKFFSKFLNKNFILYDLGCGYGELSFHYSKLCNKVYAVDSDRLIIDKAKNRFTNDNLTFDLFDITKIEYKFERSIDVINLSHVIEHIEDLESFFLKLKNKSKYVFIEVPDFESDILNIFRKINKIGINYTDDDHVYEFDRDYLFNLFDQLSFNVSNWEARHGVLRIVLENNTNFK